MTSWSSPDLRGLIPVQDQFLLAEGPGSHHGLSLSKAGYKFQLCALSLVELESCSDQKLFWTFLVIPFLEVPVLKEGKSLQIVALCAGTGGSQELI